MIAVTEQLQARMTGILFKVCLLASLVLLLWLHYDTYRAYNKKLDFAYACDDFGYLRQARLFEQNGLIGGLDTALVDENTTYLIAKLKGLAEPDQWAHMVGPHCHNYKAQTDRVILQYPPLTGLLLSLFTEGVQTRMVLALVDAILVGFLAFVAISARVWTVPLLAAALGAFLFFGLKRYGGSLSIVGSTLLLMITGYLTVIISDASRARRLPAAEFALGLVLGLSVGFRIANLLLVSGYGVILGITLVRRPGPRTGSSVLAMLAGFILGVSPVLAANAINAGRLLASTYGRADATPVVWTRETLQSGLHYYFIHDPRAGGYLIAAAVLVAAAYVLCVARRRNDLARSAAIAAISLSTTLAFMVMHEVRIPYYLFPAAAFGAATALFCLIACENDRAGDRDRAVLSPVTKVIALGAVTVAAAVVPRLLELPVYRQPETTVLFGPQAIVWADLLSGTINYYLHRQGSVIVFAPEPLQDAIISAVANDERPQFLIIDSESTKALADRLRRTMQLRSVGTIFGSDVFELHPGIPGP